MQFNAYTVPLFASALISSLLFLYAWRRRSSRGTAELSLLLLAITVWSLCAALEGITGSRTGKITWSVLSSVGIQGIPALLLLFISRYTRQDGWLSPRRTVMLFIVPAATVALAATNGLHGLLWTAVTLDEGWAGVTGVFARGPAFYAQLVYNYLLILVSLILLINHYSRVPRFYARQALVLLLALLFPWVGNIVYILRLPLLGGPDLTPVAFTLTGLLLAYAVFRYELLDLRPLARDALFEGVRDIMISLDGDNRVMDMNPVAQEFLGTSVGRLAGIPVEKALGGWPNLVERIPPEGPEIDGKLELSVEGAPRHFDLRIWPLEEPGGSVIGKLLALRDITDLKQAENELKRINAELEMYAHTVSHDLKGPITAISLACQTLVFLFGTPETPERNADIKELLENMSAAAMRAAEMTEAILTLAEAGQKPVKAQPVSVSEVVRRIVEEKAGEVELRGVRLEVDEDLGIVRAGPTHIYQIFANLIDNALKHCDSTRPLVEVRHLGTTGGVHRYLVRDDGSGVTTEDLEDIFTPFFKGGKSGGTGIGLSTVFRIVEVYEGEIRAYNEGGACFEFTLKDFQG